MDTLESIRIANLNRIFDTLPRRLLKLSEEKGEVSEAFLSVSSASNYKDKTWDDVREELVDVMIVAIDCLWLDYPDEEGISPDDKRDKINDLVSCKLQKWETAMARGKESMSVK